MIHKKKSFRSAAPVWAAFAVPIVWLAILMAGRYETGMTVFDLAAQFSEAMKTPFSLRWTPHTMKFIGIFLLLYGGAILFYYTGQKNTVKIGLLQPVLLHPKGCGCVQTD